jgi:hypothetical protein
MPTTFEFEERWEGRRGAEASAESGRKLNREWECFTDEVSNEPAVITALGLQRGVYIGTAHPDFGSCRCSFVGADPMPQTPFGWIVRANYAEPKPVRGTLPGSAPGGSKPSNNPEPSARTPLLKGNFRSRGFAKEKDLDNKPFKNPAGDWFENPPVTTEPVKIIHLTRWYDAWNIKLGAEMLDCVNDATWNGWDAKQVKIVGIEEEEKTESGRTFWEVRYTIEALFDGFKWDPVKVLNIGRNVKNAAGEPEAAKEKKTGRPITGPILLKADGSALPAGDPPTYTSFRVHRTLDMSGI